MKTTHVFVCFRHCHWWDPVLISSITTTAFFGFFSCQMTSQRHRHQPSCCSYYTMFCTVMILVRSEKYHILERIWKNTPLGSSMVSQYVIDIQVVDPAILILIPRYTMSTPLPVYSCSFPHPLELIECGVSWLYISTGADLRAFGALNANGYVVPSSHPPQVCDHQTKVSITILTQVSFIAPAGPGSHLIFMIIVKSLYLS